VEALALELQCALIQDGPLGGPCIKHPLVNEIIYFPEMNERYNAMYNHKKEALDKTLQNEDFNSYVFLHERPWRVQALSRIAAQAEPRAYWDLVASVWTDSENIWQNKRVWKKLLTAKAPHREAMMNAKEQKILKALSKKEKIQVYRGYEKKGDAKGFSWTTDYAKAEWFARRFQTEGYHIDSREIPASEAIAYLDGRNEKEILWIP